MKNKRIFIFIISVVLMSAGASLLDFKHQNSLLIEVAGVGLIAFAGSLLRSFGDD